MTTGVSVTVRVSVGVKVTTGVFVEVLVGVGVDVTVGTRTSIRVAISDRALRYEGPTFAVDRTVRQSSFWSHGLRFTTGAGLRF